MDTQEIRGDGFAKDIREEVRAAVAALHAQGTAPRLAAVVTHPDPVVMSYADAKARAASELGITLDLFVLPKASGQEKRESPLPGLATDPAAHGMVRALPLAS